MNKKNMLVFTGGGLAPALNASLYGVISQAKRFGWRIYGGARGWHSVVPQGRIIDITRWNIDPIKDRGGTFLRSSRTNIYKEAGGIESLQKKIKKYHIDAIIAIGGDDTLGVAQRLHKEFQIPIIGIPKTIDNDLFGTYWCPGFPSAAYYLAKLTAEIKTDPAYVLSRVFIIESLGWDAGWLTAASVFGGADVILPPEGKFKIKQVLHLIKKRYEENGNYALVVVCHHVNFDKPLLGVSDRNFDGFGVKRSMYSSLPLQQAIQSELKLDTKVIMPGNFLESGPPIQKDKKFAIALGKRAVLEALKKNFGQMICLKRPSMKSTKIIIDVVSLEKIVSSNARPRIFDATWFDFKNCTVKKKYLDYMKPILGSFDNFLKSDTKYLALIKRIAGK